MLFGLSISWSVLNPIIIIIVLNLKFTWKHVKLKWSVYICIDNCRFKTNQNTESNKSTTMLLFSHVFAVCTMFFSIKINVLLL